MFFYSYCGPKTAGPCRAQVNEALQAIFDTLKTRSLDEGLLTSQHSHLYDFVDSQSVQKLQRQAVQEIREMEVRSTPTLPKVLPL